MRSIVCTTQFADLEPLFDYRLTYTLTNMI